MNEITSWNTHIILGTSILSRICWFKSLLLKTHCATDMIQIQNVVYLQKGERNESKTIDFQFRKIKKLQSKNLEKSEFQNKSRGMKYPNELVKKCVINFNNFCYIKDIEGKQNFTLSPTIPVSYKNVFVWWLWEHNIRRKNLFWFSNLLLNSIN